MSKMVFSFDDYVVNDNEVVFRYSYIKDETVIGSFQEKYILPMSLASKSPLQQYILRQIHIIAGISYYKCHLGTVLHPYDLTEYEANYWNTVYSEGLGELAFLNKITAPISPFNPTSTTSAISEAINTSGAILGIGGGKDSIVGGEILRRLHVPTTSFHVSSGKNHGQAGVVTQLMEFPTLEIERYVDTSIVTFTSEHNGYNGHIPLSAIIAWVGILIAFETKSQYVVVANESASSEGNVAWQDKLVNHQWSKSLAFERMTQEFVHTYISPDITYFSIIRPYSSIKVVSLLSKLGQKYLNDFTSCNLVLRIDPDARPNGRWCGTCAKCLSSYLLLSANLDLTHINNLFSKDMLGDVSLRPTLIELLGLENHKPLDCVGTTDEIRAVVRKLIEASVEKPLLKGIDAEIIPGPAIEALMRENGEHAMPSDLSDKVLKI